MPDVARLRNRSFKVICVAVALIISAERARAQRSLESGKTVTIEISADDPVLEGHGLSSELHYKVEHDGFVYLWAASARCDPFLRIEKPTGEQVAEDDNSGGGTTAFLEREVHAGEQLCITVAGARTVEKESTEENVSIEVRLTDVQKLPEEFRPTLDAASKLIDAANAARERGEFDEVRTLAEDAIDRLLAIPFQFSLEIATALWNAGDAAYKGRDLAGARRAWDALLQFKLLVFPEEHLDLQRSRGNLANTMARMGDLSGARALAEKVLAVFERTLSEDHPDLQRARQNLGVTLRKLGEFRAARALEEKVLATRERTLPEEHPDLQAARQNLALTESKLGDLSAARALFEEVLSVRERTMPDEHPEVQVARQNLADVMRQLGELPGARALEEKVLAIRERTLPDEHPELQAARQNLAATIAKMGDLPGARALFEKVLAIRERTLSEDQDELQAARLNLAITIAEMGDFSGARLLEEKVLAIRERTLPEADPDLQRTRLNLGVTRRAMGDLAEARLLDEQVLSVLQRTLPESHTELQAVRVNLAVTLFDLGDIPGARQLFEKVLSVYERTLPEDYPDLQSARENLCWTLVQPDDDQRMVRELAALATEVAASSELARFQGRRETLERIGVTECRISTLLSIESALGKAGTSLLARTFELIETRRAIASESDQAGQVRADDTETSELRGRALALRSRVGDLVAAAATRDATTQSDTEALAGIVRERDAMEVELRRKLVASGRLTPPLTVAALTSALPEQCAAVGFRRFRLARIDRDATGRTSHSETASLLAHVLRKNGSLVRVDLGAIAEVDRLVKEWRTAIGKPVEPDARAAASGDDASSRSGRGAGAATTGNGSARDAGEALRRAVLDPVLAAAGGARILHVCLDDVLHLVPLEALPLGEGFVGDSFELRDEVSFDRLLMRRRAISEGTLVAVGAIDFDATGAAPNEPSSAVAPPVTSTRGAAAAFFALPATGPEVTTVGTDYESVFGSPPALLTGAAATKAALHELAPRARFLHLATHGYFAPESVRSILDRPEPARTAKLWRSTDFGAMAKGLSPLSLCGLALAGANLGMDSHGRVPGIITAEELAGLDLHNCELAVLSACDTNVGIHRAGLGIQSLRAALHAAGARTAVTTLWTVNDEAALALMTDFYRRVWKLKESKAQALWNAKKTLRARGAPVVDWAGWILTGDPD